MTRVAIVVLNWNGWEDTAACLSSLLRLDNANFGVFVCDNASTNDSIARLCDWGARELPQINTTRAKAGLPAFEFRDMSASANGLESVRSLEGLQAVTLIRTGANLGYAGGNNVGLRRALAEGFDAFWILNNDTEVMSDSLNALLRRMSNAPEIGMCGSTLVYADRPDCVQALGGGTYSRFKGRGAAIGFMTSASAPIDAAAVEKELSFVNGAAMLVTRKFIETVGLMQEDYFLYWEEMDWAMRARGAFKLGYAPDAVVYHKVGASIGTSDFGHSSPLSDYYLSRNRLKFCFRFSRVSLPFAYFDLLRDALRWAAKGRWDRARLIGRAIAGMPYRALAPVAP